MRQIFVTKPLLSAIPKLIYLSSKTYRGLCSPVFDMKLALCEDREKVLTFLRHHYFQDEPLRTGSQPPIQEPSDEDFHIAMVPKNTCLLAVRPDVNDFIVGAIIAQPRVKWEVDCIAGNYNSEYSKWGRILRLWAHVEKDANFFERYGVTRVIHAYALAVHRDFRGHGLGQRLLKELAQLGKKHKYEVMTTDATSVQAACACQTYGMKLLNTLAYRDYKDDKGYIVFSPPSPHEAIRSFAKRLR